jgi:hypothetical protein
MGEKKGRPKPAKVARVNPLCTALQTTRCLAQIPQHWRRVGDLPICLRLPPTLALLFAAHVGYRPYLGCREIKHDAARLAQTPEGQAHAHDAASAIVVW